MLLLMVLMAAVSWLRGQLGDREVARNSEAWNIQVATNLPNGHHTCLTNIKHSKHLEGKGREGELTQQTHDLQPTTTRDSNSSSGTKVK